MEPYNPYHSYLHGGMVHLEGPAWPDRRDLSRTWVMTLGEARELFLSLPRGEAYRSHRLTIDKGEFKYTLSTGAVSEGTILAADRLEICDALRHLVP